MQLGKLSGTRAGSVSGGRDRANSVALAALCLLLFLTFLDNTVVSVGLGSLQTDLQASIAQLQWVIGAYALTFAAIMLACGMIGDELGRKKVMLAGAGVFCAGSVLCALAPNAQTLIAGRAIMGLGAAASEPGTLSIIRHIYTDTQGACLGDRHLGRGLRARARPRPGDRRRHRGRVELARDLLVQPGVRPRRPHRGRDHRAGELRPDGGPRRYPGDALRCGRARHAHVRDHRRGDSELRLYRGHRPALRRRGPRRRVRRVGTARRAPAARPAVLPIASVHRAEHRRVLHLPRDVRDLLLHRPVPGGGPVCCPATRSPSCSRR